jgi:hypothetical protein
MTTVWEFVEKWYPGYSSSGLIAYANDLDQILTEPDQEWSKEACTIWDNCDGNKGKLIQLQDEALVRIYHDTIQNWIEQNQ